MSLETTDEKRSRITARVPLSQRELLEEAAELLGATVNQFLVQSAVHEAQRVLERETTIRLTREDAEAVFSLMDNPPMPNKKLKQAFKLHRELLGGA